MKGRPRLLLVDDDDVFRDTLAKQLRRSFEDVRTAGTLRACLREVAESEPDVVLLDLHLPDGDGLEVLAKVAGIAPSCEVVVVTGFGTVDAAVEAMRLGAFDFVTKPLKLEALVQVIGRAAERRDLRRENAGLRRMLHREAEPELLGESAAMREVRELAGRAAESEAPVLISGPSGVGKELVARLVHRRSARGGRELICVNSAALHENLLESELFGHERGAFTGATEQRPGLLEAAHRGTLFLDEIGELPMGLQPKLLRAIQFGEIRRVGGVSSLRLDVRFLAATNRDLGQAVAAQRFRADLFYRLNVIAIRIPPLRERPEDIEPLLRRAIVRSGLSGELREEHVAALRNYAWPGNVREIENFVERLKIRGEDGLPEAGALLALLDGATTPAAPQPLVRPLAELEREAIEEALRLNSDDRVAAAAMLGISVRTLYYRIASYRKQVGEPPA